MKDAAQRGLTMNLFQQRENGGEYVADAAADVCIAAVRQGDLMHLAELIPQLDESLRLSRNPLQNIKYQFVISVSAAAKSCMESGMERETAIGLRDYYICCADASIAADEINALHAAALGDFATRMRQTAQKPVYSRQIAACIDYILSNLHSKLTLSEIADALHISASHLSRSFHKEVGVTLRSYILSRRIEAAENLLKYSQYSPLDIANYLCFSSHSHFISTFRSATGMTPKQYRDFHYQTEKI